MSSEQIVNTAIDQEVRTSYIDYAMSVIVGRALPDVRDGLKPVHRRILYMMRKGGYDAGKPYRKSARIVGDVMGSLHPHGDSAIYEAMVRMAQGFSMSMPLVDGQGNFGSIDADPAAAMRYTEARLARPASLLLDDLDKKTVDFRPNYDGSEVEPIVLPARFPNLLVNGSEGIAVGMATRIPPHNVTEVINACIAMIDDPAITLDGLMAHIQGPDFPTCASVIGRAGIRKAYETGRGSITLRAKHTIETPRKGRESVVFTELPYQVNKKALVERIAELVKEKTIEGISDLRDESDRDGIRVVVDLKKDADAEIVIAQLHKHTPLQTNFSFNVLALNQGRPEQMSLQTVLKAFLAFRRQVISRRTAYLLRQTKDRAHVVAGLLVAIANLNDVIRIIRAAKDQAEAREALMQAEFETADIDAVLDRIVLDKKRPRNRLTEVQARAILDLRLHRLTGLERDKLAEEAAQLAADIARYVEILSNEAVLVQVMRDELVETRDQTLTERRTTIEDGEADYDIEDLIKREEMVVTITHDGYIKRVPLSQYRTQKRGGKGRNGMDTKDTDFVTMLISASTHTPLLFFTESGIAHKLKVYRLPEGGPTGRGRPLVNLLKIDRTDKIAAVLALPENEAEWETITAAFVTEKGDVRRNLLSDFSNVPSNGKIAMKLSDGDGNAFDRLVNVMLCTDDQDIMLTSERGQVVRFKADDVRIFAGRSSTGVRGINLALNDRVISAQILNHIDLLPGEGAAFLVSDTRKRKPNASADELAAAAGEDAEGVELTPERYDELKAAEQLILTVTSGGFGKRSSSYAFKSTRRGAKGVKDKSDHPKVGDLVGSFVVQSDDELMLTTNGGQMIRIEAGNIRLTGRNTSGVRLFNVPKGESVVAVSPIRVDRELEIDDEVEMPEQPDQPALT